MLLLRGSKERKKMNVLGMEMNDDCGSASTGCAKDSNRGRLRTWELKRKRKQRGNENAIRKTQECKRKHCSTLIRTNFFWRGVVREEILAEQHDVSGASR